MTYQDPIYPDGNPIHLSDKRLPTGTPGRLPTSFTIVKDTTWVLMPTIRIIIGGGIRSILIVER